MPDPATLSPAAPLRIRLFGPMDVRVHGEPIPSLRTRKGLWLLALLALRHDRDVPRDWIAETLWPDGTSAQALSSLRRTLTDLRKALGAEAGRIISPNVHALRLSLDGAYLDVAEFDDLVLLGDERALEQAGKLYAGPLLEGCQEEWAQQDQKRREQAVIASLETLAAIDSDRGDHAKAAVHLRRALTIDPFHETARRALLHSLAADGNYPAVVIAFREYRELLRRELNADPDPETTTLFQQLKEEARRRSAQAVEVSSLRKEGPQSAGVLPVPLTSFIGREVELTELRALIVSLPLVTMVGAGGVGKTRLAIRTAELMSEDFPHGVWFVDLAPLRDGAVVDSAALRTFGQQETTGRSPVDSLTDFLGDRKALLILDNCEHLIDSCARLASRVVQVCPNIRVLSTSRQALGVDAETVWRAPSLAVPQPRDLPQKDEGVALVLPRYESVRLFIERATTAMPSFELTERNAQAVVRIVRRLDGIPLAIELAAARVRMLSAEQIAARLDERFRLLSRGNPSAPTRQQTLRAAIDWSHNLLSVRERTLLRRLAVFAGGWTLGAAESVCAALSSARDEGKGMRDEKDPNAQRPTPDAQSKIQNPKSNIEAFTESSGDPDRSLSGFDLLDCLSDLVDRSLVIADREAGGERRYRMLETMREYALERLRESGEEREIRARHAAFYLGLAEVRDIGSADEATPDWLEQMEIEHENLRAALEHAELGEQILRLCLACYWFWNIRAYWSEGRDWFTRGLTQPIMDEVLRIRALNSAGTLAWRQADYPIARSSFLAGIQSCRVTNNPAHLASLLGNLGLVYGDEGRYSEAREYHAQALDLDRADNNMPSVAKRLTNLALIALYEADYPTARGYFHEAMGLYRSLGIRRGLAIALMNMALIELREGDYDASERYGLESLAICREISLRGLSGHALLGLGMVAMTRGQHSEAARHYRDCLMIRQDVGDSKGTADSLTNISDLMREVGRPIEAIRLWAAADRIVRDIGAVVSPSEKPEYDQSMAALRRSVRPDEFEATWQSGIALTTNAAILDALTFLNELE